MTHYVTYFDEIKPDAKAGRHTYRIGGLAVPVASIAALETAVNALADEVFGSRELTTNTEFHAADIYHAKAAFKGRDIKDRLATLGKLGRILTSDAEVKRVTAAIHTDRLQHDIDASQAAFAFFLERVQMAIGRDGGTLLIGDLDDTTSRQMIREYSEYRAVGKTPWTYGIPIPGVIDAVHFAQSHHSRMIQLADAYLFLSIHNTSGRKGWLAEALRKEIADIAFWPHRYKEWPNA